MLEQSPGKNREREHDSEKDDDDDDDGDDDDEEEEDDGGAKIYVEENDQRYPSKIRVLPKKLDDYVVFSLDNHEDADYGYRLHTPFSRVQ